MKLSTKEIALISVFAALHVIVSRMPGIPVIGTESGKIELTVVLVPVTGIILGPWIGGLAAFLGNFVAWLIPATTFYGMLNLPTGPIGAIVAGALARNDKKSNWKVAALILLVLNALWYISPPGIEVPYYPFLHLGALALILTFKGKVSDLIRSEDKQKVTWGTTIAGFSGIMANHMAGNLIFIASIGWFIQLRGIKDALVNLGFNWLKSGLPKGDPTGLGALFALMLPISVIERLLMTAIAVPISVGVLYTLKKSGIISI